MEAGKRVALITGGSRGIGHACVSLFLQEGYRVISVANKNIYQQNFSDDLQKNLHSINYDLSYIKGIPSLMHQALGVFGRLDVLINAAGIVNYDDISETTSESWDAIFDINLKSVFFLVQAAVPYLSCSKNPRIINISSNAGRMGGLKSGASYSSSKGGLIALTYSLASKLAKSGITVNCIAPGPVNTEMFNSFSDDDKRGIIERIPLGRIGHPGEIAQAALYFAGVYSGYTTGAVLDINGGLFMG